MVELGMSPMNAIKSATSRPADMLDMSGQIGLIAPGAYADVIAVDGDPLRDIKVLENVHFVMKGGKVFKQYLAEGQAALGCPSVGINHLFSSVILLTVALRG